MARLDVADEVDRFGQTEPLDLSLQRRESLAIARQRQRDLFAVGMQPRHRIDQEVRALDVPELADIDDVGGVVGLDDGIELLRGHPVEYAAHQPLGRADGALIGIAREGAFEQEQIGGVHQRAFEAAVECALDRIQRVMQRAAMRRIDSNGAIGAGFQADEGAGFGAMAVQDVRLQPPDQTHDMRPYQHIGGKRFAANGKTMNTKREARRDRRQRRLGALAAGQAVGDNADVVATVDLPVGEVEDVSEDSADWRAHRVQDTKRVIGHHGHDQNQRSPTRMVSPGPSAVPSGTTKRDEPEWSVWVSVTRSRSARGENPPAMATAVSTLMLGT